MTKREKTRLARMRRDPFGRLSLEVQRYLNSVGWNAVMTSNARIQGDIKEVGNFELVVSFIGWKKK